jgi:ribosomal subunit interface protein
MSNPIIVIHNRNSEANKEWLEHLRERTLKLDRFGNHIISFDVEIMHQVNPRLSSKAWHIEITAKVDGAVIRATGEASEPERAYERSFKVMESNLRRAARRHHWSRHGRKATLKVSQKLT